MFKQLFIAIALLITSSSLMAAKQVVHVGGVYFPPYVFKFDQLSSRGLLPQLVSALNAAQSDFDFVIRPTSLSRRYDDLLQGRNHLSLFENPQWGWQGIAHETVDMGLEDAELFVARSESMRDQDYFTELKGKRLALFSGYHYAIAGFNNDSAYLIKNLNAVVSRSHDGNIMMVMHRRADVALVTRSYIYSFLDEHPDYANKLLISERVDQVYRHQAILSPASPISAQQLHELFEVLRRNGQLEQIFSVYKIYVRPVSSVAGVGD